MNYELNFREVAYALCEALDLVGIDDIRHGKRVALMAAECAKEGGYGQPCIDELICIGMLHDCGVSTTDMHKNLVTQLEWKDEHLHCVRGAALVEKVQLLRQYVKQIYHHHTHWNELEPLAMDDKVKRQANLIYLVDRVDALRTQIEGADLEKREKIEADIFQALVQERPYREAMDAPSAFKVLEEMADAGKIDTDVVAAVGHNLDQAYALAKSHERSA